MRRDRSVSYLRAGIEEQTFTCLSIAADPRRTGLSGTVACSSSCRGMNISSSSHTILSFDPVGSSHINNYIATAEYLVGRLLPTPSSLLRRLFSIAALSSPLFFFNIFLLRILKKSTTESLTPLQLPCMLDTIVGVMRRALGRVVVQVRFPITFSQLMLPGCLCLVPVLSNTLVGKASYLCLSVPARPAIGPVSRYSR